MPNTTNSWLGIDFGTCSTSAAMLVGRELRQVNLSQSQFAESPDMPTAVFIEPEGRIVVGNQAVRSRLRDPSRYLDSFKLEIERSPGRLLAVAGVSKTISWAEIVAAVLRHVKAVAEKDLNNEEPIPCAVLTVPALYAQNGTGWEIMEQAGKMAGFEQVRIVREPHAAALYYDHLIREARHDTGGDGELVLVYDLGGGTFDPALIRRSGNDYPVERAQGAGVRCGGIFFDEELRKDFKKKCPDSAAELMPPQRNPDGTVPASQAARARAFGRAVTEIDKFLLECKHGFSQPGTEEFDEPAPPLSADNYRMTRTEFDAMLSPLLDSTIECCEELLRCAGVGWKDLSRVIMVGGSCSLPVVRDKIASAMERAGGDASRICWQRIAGTDQVVDPRFAVARGACLAAPGPHGQGLESTPQLGALVRRSEIVVDSRNHGAQIGRLLEIGTAAAAEVDEESIRPELYALLAEACSAAGYTENAATCARLGLEAADQIRSRIDRARQMCLVATALKRTGANEAAEHAFQTVLGTVRFGDDKAERAPAVRAAAAAGFLDPIDPKGNVYGWLAMGWHQDREYEFSASQIAAFQARAGQIDTAFQYVSNSKFSTVSKEKVTIEIAAAQARADRASEGKKLASGITDRALQARAYTAIAFELIRSEKQAEGLHTLAQARASAKALTGEERDRELLRIVIAQLKLGLIDQAERTAESIEESRFDISAQCALAIALKSTGDAERASECFEKVIRSADLGEGHRFRAIVNAFWGGQPAMASRGEINDEDVVSTSRLGDLTTIHDVAMALSSKGATAAAREICVDYAQDFACEVTAADVAFYSGHRRELFEIAKWLSDLAPSIQVRVVASAIEGYFAVNPEPAIFRIDWVEE